ncbi:MAG: hypothetical protein K9J74_04825 [Sulfuritalea sp.]|nr:hypothetical protein [Sulfuritalea sp.]
MKFALCDGQRQEAQPNLSGQCPACDQAMIAKCGEVKIWHWAHKGRRTCDPWWENETEWHRAWKGQFTESWQEVVHQADNGERHIADVKTDQGWVIEFQHSRIEPEERRSRDSFYPKLVWVVDGARLKRDRKQFQNALAKSIFTYSNLRAWKISPDECVLLKEWADSPAHVFFDFGGESLWLLLSNGASGSMYVKDYPRTQFIRIHSSGEIHKGRSFDKFAKELTEFVAQFESVGRVQPLKQSPQLQRQSLPRLVRCGRLL